MNASWTVTRLQDRSDSTGVHAHSFKIRTSERRSGGPARPSGAQWAPVTDRPWDVPPPLDAAFASERFVDAFRTVVRMHAGQDRWDPSIPFVSHLLGTCAIALEHGASEDQAIAALFHDAIEDVEPSDEVRATIRAVRRRGAAHRRGVHRLR